MTGTSALAWRALGEADLPALAALATDCLAADGGQPYAADPAFLTGRFLAGARGLGCFASAGLVCATAVREAAPGSAAADLGAAAVTTGLVHPGWRRRGLGGHALDQCCRIADADGCSRDNSKRRTLCAETETLSAGADALYTSRGFSQVFAEDVLRLPASAPVPAVPEPAGIALAEWGQAAPERFWGVYTAAFRGRPGFPGEPAAEWIAWVAGDEDFRPDWALLATIDGADAGFVIGDAGGWIAKLGVAPQARSRGIGGYLTAAVIRRMRASGEAAIVLNVGIDNPRAAALYRRLGFLAIGRRARYVSGEDRTRSG